MNMEIDVRDQVRRVEGRVIQRRNRGGIINIKDILKICGNLLFVYFFENIMFRKSFEQRHSTWQDNYFRRQITKQKCQSHLLISLKNVYLGLLETLSNTSIVIALAFPTEIHSKVLLLKTQHYLSVVHGHIKRKVNYSLPPCWPEVTRLLLE